MADTTVAKEQLKSIVERIERLEEEKKALAGDIAGQCTVLKNDLTVNDCRINRGGERVAFERRPVTFCQQVGL